MKFLCVCNGGNVRSVGLARQIKDSYGTYTNFNTALFRGIKHEAIAIGIHCTTKETIKLLINWADKVIDLSDDEETREMLKEMSNKKYFKCYIGEDVWDNPYHPELKKKLKKIVEELLNEETY